MILLVFSALLSVAATQCGNSCKCGVTTCCQTTYSSGSPYSIFNIGNNQQYSYAQQYGSNQQYSSGQQFGSSARPDAARSACLKINPIQYSLARLYQSQPAFARIVPNSDDFKQIDNICSTLFPLLDDSTTYVEYDSFVYCDGSYSVRTTVVDDDGSGTIIRGNAFYSFHQRFIASLGNNIYVGCSQDAYGDSGTPSIYAVTLDSVSPLGGNCVQQIQKIFINEDSGTPSVFATSLGSVSPLGGGCLQQIQNIIQCVGQGQADGLYVLPYRLPTRCVTQQVCTLFNPLLYSNNQYQYRVSNNACNNGNC